MTRSTRRHMHGLTLAVVVGSLLVVPVSAHAATCHSSGGQPRAGAGDAGASSVAVVSPCVAWFVGSISNAMYDSRTLIERWNGTQWKTQPAPSPGDKTTLSGVAATSATNAWAVGVNSSSDTHSHALIERWNGTSWTVQPSQNPGAHNTLVAVAALSDKNAWAVGFSSSPTVLGHTLIEHWNGAAWKLVATPNPPSGDSETLSDVDIVSANNVWAVGFAATPFNSNDPLVLHWNGHKWSATTLPAVGVVDDLRAVDAASANDVWAVGSSEITTTDQLIMHWNGIAWKHQKSPSPGHASELDGVVALSASDAWAVGWQQATRTSPLRTLLEHWDGTSWRVVASPNPRAGYNALTAVDADSPHDLWGVGTYSNGTSFRPLAFQRQ